MFFKKLMWSLLAALSPHSEVRTTGVSPRRENRSQSTHVRIAGTWRTSILIGLTVLITPWVLTERLFAQNPPPLQFTEYSPPTANSKPLTITAGPDGNFWFTESGANKIGKITPAGAVTEYPIPTPNSNPNVITSGPDGALWFTEGNGNRIGRVTTTGSFTEFALPTPGSLPVGITAGPDGNLWFTELMAKKVGKITPAGNITEFAVPTSPQLIVTGSDGNLWYTGVALKLGKITPAGAVTEISVPPPSAPLGITKGPDGNIWFTDQVNKIRRFNIASGELTSFPTDSQPFWITSAPDGNLYFTSPSGAFVAQITTGGVITKFPVRAGSGPSGIASLPPPKSKTNAGFFAEDSPQAKTSGGGTGRNSHCGDVGAAGFYLAYVAADDGKVAIARAQVIACPTINVSPEELQGGLVGYEYPDARLSARPVRPTGGQEPYEIEVQGLPDGLMSTNLFGDVALIYGIPNIAGTFTVTVSGRDANCCPFSRTYSLTIKKLDTTFSAKDTATSGPPNQVLTADFNNDGAADLVYIDSTSDTLFVSLNILAGFTVAPSKFALPTTPRAVYIGQSNIPSQADGSPDNDLDIFVATDGPVGVGQIRILENQGAEKENETFTAGPGVGNAVLEAGSKTVGILVLDANGDNGRDIIALNQGSGTVTTFLAEPSPKWGYAAPVESLVGTNPIAMAPLNFNNDDFSDLVFANAPGSGSGSGSLSIFTGDGKGAFQLAATFQDPIFNPVAAIVARFGDDVLGDIAVLDAGVPDNPSQPGGVYLFKVSDLLLKPKGADIEPTFRLVKSFPAGKNPSAFAVGDFNNDGKPDLVVANSSSNDVSLLLGDGKGGFAPAVNFPVGNNPVSVAVADVNSDGKDDIIVANKDSKSITVLTNTTAIPDFALVSNNFSQFGDGLGISSTTTLVNPSISQTAYGRVKIFDSNGNPLSVDTIQDGKFFFGIPPRGVRFFPTDGRGNLVVGTVQVKSGYPIAGTILFSGAGLGVAGVPAVTPLTKFVIPVESDSARGVRTGVALSSSVRTKFDVTLRLHDATGALVQNGTITATLLANAQLVKFIEELYAGKGIDFSKFRGTLEVISQQPANGMAIRVSPGQLATLPVTGAGSKQLLFAQIGEANGISSTMTFVNPSLDKTAVVTVKMFDDNGAPLTLNLNGVDQSGQFTFTLAPMATASFSTPGTSARVKVGSVVVSATENIGGTINFGGGFGLAGVPASEALSSFIAPVEQKTQGGVTVGLALMNLGTSPIKIRLTLRDENGNLVPGGAADVAVAGQGHVAKFIGQFFSSLNLADFRGTITGETTGQMAVTEIRQSGSPLEFATLPVAEIIP